MPNHVHLVAVPREKDSLHLAIGEAHRPYTRMINFREGSSGGHLWQGRFSSCVMDEKYLLACVRYVENNPVRAKLSGRPESWRWSSAAAHVFGKEDRWVTVQPLPALINRDWTDFLRTPVSEDKINAMQKHERNGRPVCMPMLLEQLEAVPDRPLKPKKAGRKPKRNK
jgi:putative transposase